jgi:cell division protein FtsL
MLVGSVVVSVIMLAVWFPLSPLVSQRSQLAAASAELSQLKSQDKALQHEQSTLTASGDISRLAREQYQLVQPGQRLVQVLPPSGAPAQSGAGQAPYPGDPGLTKPVAPSAIALLPSAGTTTTTGRASAPGSAPQRVSTSSQPGFVQRVLSTLAFWRR